MAEKAPTIEQRLGAALTAQMDPPPAPEQPAAPPPRAPAPEPDDDAPTIEGAVEGQEAAPDGDEGPGWFPDRLEDIAEAGGWAVADMYKVRVTVNGPDGKPVEVPIGEWKDYVQQSMQLDAIRRSEREAHERAEAVRKQGVQDLQARITEANGLAEAAMQRLMARHQAINWEHLRAVDPAEYAAKRADMQTEFNEIQAIRQRTLLHAQAQWQEEQAKQAKQYHEYLRGQEREARSLIPEFGDAEKAEKFKSDVVNWMKAQRYSDYEMAAVSNSAKLLNLVRTKMQLGSDLKAKRVEQGAKRFIRPGAAQPRGSRDAEAYKAIRSKLAKTGSLKDAANVFGKFFGG